MAVIERDPELLRLLRPRLRTLEDGERDASYLELWSVHREAASDAAAA